MAEILHLMPLELLIYSMSSLFMEVMKSVPLGEMALRSSLFTWTYPFILSHEKLAP